MRVAWVLVALLAAGCGSLQKTEPPPKPFIGTKWTVVLELPLQGTQPWLQFGRAERHTTRQCFRLRK